MTLSVLQREGGNVIEQLTDLKNIQVRSRTLTDAHGRSRRNREKEKKVALLHPGAGTIKPEIISSLITGGSEGGGGQTKLSIMSSVTRIIPVRSGGSVREDLIIIQRPTSSCNTLSRYIMSRSLTIAPLITMISSPLMIPESRVSLPWYSNKKIQPKEMFGTKQTLVRSVRFQLERKKTVINVIRSIFVCMYLYILLYIFSFYNIAS